MRRPSSTARRTCPSDLRLLAAFNPLSGIFGLYRSAFFPEQFDLTEVLIGAGMCVLLLAVGLVVFRACERAVLKEI